MFYSLFSILPLTTLIVSATAPLPFTIVWVVAGSLVIWFVVRASGFAQLARMQYSLDFLKGVKGAIYDPRRDIWLSRRTNLTWFLAATWPWFGYSIASVEGSRLFAAIFLVIFVVEFAAIMGVSRMTRVDSVFEWKVEDWAFVLGDVCIGFIAIVPGAPDWTWALATPLFVLCGTKSLFDAPKELAV